MGSISSTITLIFLTLLALQASRIEGQEIKSARLLDLVIRDYTFKSYTKNFKTGKLHQINLPSNLSGIHVDTIRLRCGSLHRYGATVREFHLLVGTSVHPCSTRVMIIRQNLGPDWSSLYYDNYDLSGYELISPVLGLLAYNVGATNTATVPSQLGIRSGKKPITIDFSKMTSLQLNKSLSSSSPGIIPLCARFDQDGKVSLSNTARPNVCVATRHGHFGLVVESPLMPLKRKVSRLKIAIGSSVGAALGAFLLSLLAIAVFANAKKKARMEEMERRAYEEEALQVSMVGHVRALTASGTRTVPVIEHEHDQLYKSNHL